MGQLTIAERLQIEHGLKNRCSLEEIARSRGKAVSTISREIRKNSMPGEKGAQGRVLNRCVQRRKMSCTAASSVCMQWMCKRMQMCFTQVFLHSFSGREIVSQKTDGESSGHPSQ